MRNVNGAGELEKIVLEEKLPVELAELDVDDDASVRDAFGKVLTQGRHIDVLVNNAGVGGGGAVEEVTMDFFRQTMETNFFGALRCMKAVISSMRERRQGCIITSPSPDR
jgi:NAD(P)-dependent dehydrogenase (short-subunit alcohol dehydrogenase family)